MAIVASMLRSEMRRHLLMNVSLVAGCIVGGTVVTNERGLFVPLSIHGMSETARAFAAMFTQSQMLPDLTDVRMASPLDPFEVTADSRDLRRRLMDSMQWLPEQAAEFDKDLTQVSSQMITPTEVASNTNPGAPIIASGSGQPATSGAGEQAAAAQPEVVQQQQQAQQSSILSDNSKTQTSSTATDDQMRNIMKASTTGTTDQAGTTDPVVDAVPEPSTWMMLVAGFGMIGYLLRANSRRRRPEGGVAEA